MEHEIVSHTVTNLIIFVLAIYVGYHVVWTAISGVCSAGVTVQTTW